MPHSPKHAVTTLATDRYQLDLLPSLGGSIGGLRWWHPDGRWINLLRPLQPGPATGPTVLDVSCFPLTPFANRIRDGRFRFAGRDLQLAPGVFGPHPEHGHGWLQPWLLQPIDASSAELILTHAPDAWPFPYTIRQRFTLEPDGLTIDLEARNDGNEPMPFGFGLHPYFPRTPSCMLRASVNGFWETDAAVLPTRHTAVPATLDPRTGMPVSHITLDNAFTGWDGIAHITWPELGTRLAIVAEEPLRVLFVYVPQGETYFCAEPASNVTDAFNLAEAGRTDTGMMALAPGEMIEASVTFEASVI